MIGRALTAALLAVSVANAQEAPPASAFARLPAVEAPTLSPDGSRIAQIERNEDGAFLVVRAVVDLSPLAVVSAGDAQVREVLWSDDHTVIVIVADALPLWSASQLVEFKAAFSVDLADGNTVRQLMRRRERNVNYADREGRFTPNTAHIVGREPGAGRLLMVDLDQEGFSLFSVDPHDDERRLVESGVVFTRDWVIDHTGTPIVRTDYDDRSNLLSIRSRREQAWELVRTEAPTTSVWGVDAAGALIVRAELPDTGRFGLYVLSLETGVFERVYYVEDAHDVDTAVRDPHTNGVVGAIVRTDYSVAVWFEAELKARQVEIDRLLGEVPAMITSWSRDRKRVVARLDNGAEPTLFYLYDAEASRLTPIASPYPEARAAGIAPRYAVSYPARDGVQIPAYVTMIDGLARPAPLVVLPHDGPQSRDVGGFDWLAHFLASRGYVVVQPNFRGSTGYGTAWRDAGKGAWGSGMMQNDLTDVVAAFVEEGIADPDRVCIVGRGYGGYAALAGAVFTPGLYRCAAAIASVTDLNALLSDERTFARSMDWVVDYLPEVVGGDPGVARAKLAEMSPVDHAGEAQASILLIHGREDTVVPISQSRRMHTALERANKDVELIELRGEDHELSNAETRLEALLALEGFLAKHLN